jgi:protein-S-isoprenylcysteine O-methyltransferase Ste14
MLFWEEPFFWALVSMFGLVGCCAVVGSQRIGRNTLLSGCMVAIFDMGRFALVLPDQSRFESGGALVLLGGLVLFAGGYLGLAPCVLIRPINVAESGMELATTGFYTVIRNPIYLGELLMSLGWSLLHRSTTGVCLTPVWWTALLILIVIEEESLERALGQSYLDYKQRVRGRILPGLPI